ncbi:MAG: hypothetical protein ACYDDI_17730, partial [Candidatus Acidiferrales bacterium]
LYKLGDGIPNSSPKPALLLTKAHQLAPNSQKSLKLMTKMRVSKAFLRRTSNYTFWFLIVGLALSAVYTHRSQLKAAVRPPRQAALEAFKPFAYTVTLQDYAVQANGSAIPTGRFTWAVRGDGSRVIDATSSPNGGRTAPGCKNCFSIHFHRRLQRLFS